MKSDNIFLIILLIPVISFFICMGYSIYSDNEIKIKQIETYTKLYEEGKLSQEVYILKMEQLR